MRLSNARLPDSDPLVDIAVDDGTITSITPAAGPHAPGDLDVAGRLVLPGFVETHLHLDKAHLDSLEPNPDGTLAGAIAVTGRLKKAFDHEGMAERARRVLDTAIGHGTTLIRAHPDVDPVIGTLGVEVLAELREEYAGRIDLQIVAFPQEGIEQAPGTLPLMRRAIELGADVVGGCTYNEPDVAACERHVLAAFDLAAEHDLPLDLHTDFADDTSDERFAMASFIARTTLERGYEGRVALGHMTSLGSLQGHARDLLLKELAAARIAVVLLPHTDLHLGGRNDPADVRRGIAPLRALWEADVPVGFSSNNVRNAFTPFGNANMLETGLFLAQTAHLGSPDDLRRVVEMATTGAAATAGIAASYGLRPGAYADLVVLDATDPVTALLDRASCRYVLKRGRLVAETEQTQTLHDPSTHDPSDARGENPMKTLRALPSEVVASILAATTAFIGGTALHLPPWAIFIGWAGTYLAGGAKPDVLRSMWLAMPAGSTFALVIVLLDTEFGTLLGDSQLAMNATLAIIILVVNTALMYTGRTKAFHLIPAMFLGFASYFATFFGNFGWAPGHAWAAWVAVIAMNALGPVYAVVATWISGAHEDSPTTEPSADSQAEATHAG